MNLDVFPVGYYANFVKRKNKPIKSLQILNEMKKGIMNGPATIIIDEKKVCKTSFTDHIEHIKSSNHPVGKQNLVSRDGALLNCLLVVFSFIFMIMIMVVPDASIAWICIGVVLYITQIVEALFFSQTAKLLSHQNAWDDLDLFRLWFYELKKCRPVMTFKFTPTKEQSEILKELDAREKSLTHAYTELQTIRK